NLFDKLQYWLALLGISMTMIFVISLLKGRNFNKWILLSFRIIALIFLIIIFTGITLRWIAGGYFPLSNSYEVMLFISGFSILVGLIYSKKQPLLLSLSMILAFSFLLVAHLMNINPAIGNLVPVLKSYWLSIHVAIITSSYAIFGLVMLISLVNLSLFLFVKEADFDRIILQIRNLGTFNNILLIIGLYLMVTGTIFGAVWANESWGRYWGWDPKESWALISILIYAFVSHMRLIPAFKNDYITNLASFWAFASILMTFFGVNYLMSGIHSYAGTGSAEMPLWVLILTALLVIYTSLAGVRYYRINSK
ncbi:MAG: cytochrome c biogenesis protein CcsA, partial [Prolixibacteraceae bacterium]|nr:cytochrome c biogenesis protein CcsA [Prolixibacteraceae bacterium]